MLLAAAHTAGGALPFPHGQQWWGATPQQGKASAGGKVASAQQVPCCSQSVHTDMLSASVAHMYCVSRHPMHMVRTGKAAEQSEVSVQYQLSIQALHRY